MQESNDRIPHVDTYEIYGLVLADAWKETRVKKGIIQSFIDSSFLEKYCDILNIQNKPEYVNYCFDLIKEFDNTSYYILSLIWRVM